MERHHSDTMIPPATTLTRANSYTNLHLTGKDGTTTSTEKPLLTLPPTRVNRALRAASSYHQRESLDRLEKKNFPATSLAIQHGCAQVGGQGYGNTMIGYDLLLLGTHATLKSRRGQETNQHVLFVAILPHIARSVEKEGDGSASSSSSSSSSAVESSASRQFSLFKRTQSGGLEMGSQVPAGPVQNQPSVVLHSTYGDLPPAAVAQNVQGKKKSKICGGKKRASCNTILSRMFQAVLHPISTVQSMFGGSTDQILPPVPRHYPKLSTLAEHGLSLEQTPWLWQDQPFFGLDLVWQDGEDEWNSQEEELKEKEFETPASITGINHPRRELPIHPSHLCVDPVTGEILITDHERHAVYSLLPVWILTQKLVELITPKIALPLPGAKDSALCSSNEPSTDEWLLPLPDVLLDLVVGYLGNQVRLLAGESNVKGCRDGSSSDAHFNAPNGVTVHPKTGQIFVTDGHWNSRICSLTPNVVPMKHVQAVSTTASGSSSSTRDPIIPTPPAPRWNVASIPLHPVGSATRARKNTWFSAVRHEGSLWENAPALWPLRLPTSPIVLQDASLSRSALGVAGAKESTDALVLLDEELHILRAIPLCGSQLGQISTVSGSFGTQGMADGWSDAAQFLFPQSLISIRHPLSQPELLSRHGGARGRNLTMKDRQAILVADTGNDRLCLVNLIAREEIRLEKRKQRMMRRQMRAIALSKVATATESESSSFLGSVLDVGASSSSEESEDDSSEDYDSDATSPGSHSGPLVGHVESIPIRGLVPPQLEATFVATPWTPWSEMKGSDRTSEESKDDADSDHLPSPSHSSMSTRTRSNGPSYAGASSSSTSSSSSLAPPASAEQLLPSIASTSSSSVPLPPCPYVHRGQNTFLRKLCVTSQGRIIGLNRLGLVAMEWKQSEF